MACQVPNYVLTMVTVVTVVTVGSSLGPRDVLKVRISGSGLGLELKWFSVYVALGGLRVWAGRIWRGCIVAEVGLLSFS